MGSKIKQLRKEIGMTQKHLAYLLGLSTSTIQKYELEQREPTIETLSKMSEIFGVSIETFTKKFDFSLLPSVRSLPKDFFENLQLKPNARIKKLMPNDEYTVVNDSKASNANSIISTDASPHEIYYFNKHNKDFYLKKYLSFDIDYITYVLNNYFLNSYDDSDTKYILSNVFDIDLGFLTPEQALEIKSTIIFAIKLKLEEFKNRENSKNEGGD